MSLPAFRYHPDPLATGSVIRASTGLDEGAERERFFAALGGYQDCD